MVNISAVRTCLGGEAPGEQNPAQVGRVGPGKEFGLECKNKRKTLADFKQAGVLWSNLHLLKCAGFQIVSCIW